MHDASTSGADLIFKLIEMTGPNEGMARAIKGMTKVDGRIIGTNERTIGTDKEMTGGASQ